MLRKSILIVIFILLFITPSYGQEGAATPSQVSDIVNSAIRGIFGGGGELPVRDATVRSQIIIEVLKTIEILKDHLLQALTGGGPQNETTAQVSAEISELSEDGYAHTYGSYDLGTWNDLHAVTHVYPEGGWVRNEEERFKRSITTYRALQRMLQARKDALPADQERARGIYDAIAGCESRNCAIQASGHATTELIWQSHLNQQIEMASANAANVYYAHEMNEEIARKAQERYFMENGGRVVAMPSFEDVGLLR